MFLVEVLPFNGKKLFVVRTPQGNPLISTLNADEVGEFLLKETAPKKE